MVNTFASSVYFNYNVCVLIVILIQLGADVRRHHYYGPYKCYHTRHLVLSRILYHRLVQLLAF